MRSLNAESIRLGLNRNLKSAFFRRADPDGAHVINIFMVHEHAGGRRVAPHYRCEVLAKLRRSDDPSYLILDIPFALWDALPGLRKNARPQDSLAACEAG